jgi:hypothetical protein
MMYEIGIPRDVIGAIVGHCSEGGAASRTLIRHYLKSDLIKLKTSALEKWDAAFATLSPALRRKMSCNSPTNDGFRISRIRLVAGRSNRAGGLRHKAATLPDPTIRRRRTQPGLRHLVLTHAPRSPGRYGRSSRFETITSSICWQAARRKTSPSPPFVIAIGDPQGRVLEKSREARLAL